jgi:two-component system, NtrC family, sensor histidine kinase HydH
MSLKSTDDKAMSDGKRPTANWMDALWLMFLLVLALLPPRREIHKQLILLAFGLLQLSENWLVSKLPRRGPSYVVFLKIGLAMLLIDHTTLPDEPSINSVYYPIYYLPLMTAAEYFGSWGTLIWTTLASATYASYLYPGLHPELREFEIGAESYELLALRISFFFLAAMVVNRFVVESKRQTQRYHDLAETLSETNRRLERVQAEARRSERLAALGQLSAGLAHEIRNPLGVIKGSAEMLGQKLGESNPIATELAGYISTETNRLSALVTRFLNFARPLQADLAPQSIIAILDRALTDVASVWKGPAVQIEKYYAPNLPMAAVDEGLCEQAFINIVQNGFDAMGGASGGLLRVKVATATANERDGVEVRIEDTGPGIPAELREQIFNPFVTTKKTGVGLGLSIVSKIMDGHHGFVRLENGRDGTGACFVMFFPAATEPASGQEPAHMVIS